MTVVATIGTLTETATSLPSYNQDFINLGTLCFKATGTGTNNWVGPLPGTAVARPGQQTVAMPGFQPSVYRWSDTQDWIFLFDVAAAAATRRCQLWIYTRGSSPTFTYKGTVTLTLPAATNHTIRAGVASVYKHSTGTVSGSGTSITGSGTTWTDERIAVGARIGFGSTDPTQITTWYQISAIGSNTSITTTTSVGTVDAGTRYVIEEIRLNLATTNATATNGGLFVAKGLQFETFTDAGTTIPAATTTDNIRAVYWLADAATVTNTVAGGLALDVQDSSTSHDAYIVNGTTSLIIYKYNLRASLSGLASGKSTSAFTLATGTQAVTGTAQQTNGLELATTASGTGSGVKSLYLTTSTRIYRAALTNITSGNVSWLSDNIIEQPTGTSNTIPLSNSMREISYAPSIDRFYVTTNALQTYVLQYDTSSTQWEGTFGTNIFSVHPNAVDTNAPNVPSVSALPLSIGNAGGILYAIRNTTTVTSNQMYAIPIGAGYIVGSGEIILPRIATPGASKYYRAYVNSQKMIGGDALGTPPEPYKLWYRTSGISDNSGSWTAVGDDGDLSSIGSASYIQFRVTFRVVGNIMLPSKIYNVVVVYEYGDNLPGFLEWNLNDSNTSDGTIGFTQNALNGGTFALQIDYFRSDTNTNVLSQASTSSTNGVFEYWNGSAWVSGVSTDTVGLRRRFRPTAGLPSGVNVYAKLKTI